MRNKQKLGQVRTLSTVFIGVAAGIIGFDGVMGMLFYFSCDVAVGLFLIAYFLGQSSPYFSSLGSIVLASFMQNFMTFMVTWVLFYNLVYIL